jgi:hypothetical protein
MRVSGVLLLLVLLASPWTPAAAADDCAEGRLRPATIAASDKLVLRWNGKVNRKMADAIDAAFEANKRRVNSVELLLHSCGGGIDDMASTIAVLRHIKETHALITVVDQGATCASACIPIFLASDNRRAALSSLWFFHRSWRKQLSGGVDAVQTGTAGKTSVSAFHDRYYVPAGVSRPWLDKLRNVIENTGGYWQTGRDLWESKSGMITETIGDVLLQEDRTIYIAPAPGCTAMCRG